MRYASFETDAGLGAKETELLKKQMRFYIDTSVFGGYWDDIFAEDTAIFFEYVANNNVEIVYSDITVRELEGAPSRIRELPKKLAELEGMNVKYIKMNEEAGMLAKKYIEEGALIAKCENDARHIALATTYGVSGLTSWNFKHMVNFMRIRRYNSINIRLGYNNIDIRTPKEMTP